jgi:hypothetical protein
MTFASNLCFAVLLVLREIFISNYQVKYCISTIKKVCSSRCLYPTLSISSLSVTSASRASDKKLPGKSNIQRITALEVTDGKSGKHAVLLTLRSVSMQCNAMQIKALQCNAMQYNAVNAMQCNAMQYNAMCNAMHNAM